MLHTMSRRLLIHTCMPICRQVLHLGGGGGSEEGDSAATDGICNVMPFEEVGPGNEGKPEDGLVI